MNDSAEEIIARHLARLSKRADWAEDDTAIGGQAANIAQQLADAGLITGETPETDVSEGADRG